jgi:hypothetical protein
MIEGSSISKFNFEGMYKAISGKDMSWDGSLKPQSLCEQEFA